MNCSTPGLPVHHQLPEFTQTHVHQVSDAIQLSHPLSSPLFSVVSGLHSCAGFSLVAVSRGYALVVVQRLLSVVVSLLAELGP